MVILKNQKEKGLEKQIYEWIVMKINMDMEIMIKEALNQMGMELEFNEHDLEKKINNWMELVSKKIINILEMQMEDMNNEEIKKVKGLVHDVEMKMMNVYLMVEIFMEGIMNAIMKENLITKELNIHQQKIFIMVLVELMKMILVLINEDIMEWNQVGMNESVYLVRINTLIMIIVLKEEQMVIILEVIMKVVTMSMVGTKGFNELEVKSQQLMVIQFKDQTKILLSYVQMVQYCFDDEIDLTEPSYDQEDQEFIDYFDDCDESQDEADLIVIQSLSSDSVSCPVLSFVFYLLFSILNSSSFLNYLSICSLFSLIESSLIGDKEGFQLIDEDELDGLIYEYYFDNQEDEGQDAYGYLVVEGIYEEGEDQFQGSEDIDFEDYNQEEELQGYNIDCIGVIFNCYKVEGVGYSFDYQDGDIDEDVYVVDYYQLVRIVQSYSIYEGNVDNDCDEQELEYEDEQLDYCEYEQEG
ncbi:MAG: hypothetical protein EZS28_008954 [Streblomastix strix]|uniref:Uncharacterized protein n=1 Tax=Streblomastix strix TaxID=222440 RepID=A0A5J4WKQ6_9EUKA|nr:MAG: hypothetical protein EZS28_008954 [Streblomastix strix]